MFAISVVDVSTRRAASASADVEREKPAEARVADDLDRSVLSEPVDELPGRLGLPRDADLQGRQSPQNEPGGVGCGHGAGP